MGWTSSVTGSVKPGLVQKMFPIGEACKSQSIKNNFIQNWSHSGWPGQLHGSDITFYGHRWLRTWPPKAGCLNSYESMYDADCVEIILVCFKFVWAACMDSIWVRFVHLNVQASSICWRHDLFCKTLFLVMSLMDPSHGDFQTVRTVGVNQIKFFAQCIAGVWISLSLSEFKPLMFSTLCSVLAKGGAWLRRLVPLAWWLVGSPAKWREISRFHVSTDGFGCGQQLFLWDQHTWHFHFNAGITRHETLLPGGFGKRTGGSCGTTLAWRLNSTHNRLSVGSFLSLLNYHSHPVGCLCCVPDWEDTGRPASCPVMTSTAAVSHENPKEERPLKRRAIWTKETLPNPFGLQTWNIGHVM